LLIPLDVDYLALVAGALDELTYEDSFEQVTGITPAQAAAAFLKMFDSFTFDGDCMIGQIIGYVSTSAPAGVIACDGSTHLKSAYPDLYAVIDPFYIIDATHFSVPDLRGRVIVGVGTGPGLTTRNLGDILGEEKHTLTIAELAAHSHTDLGHTHVESAAAPNATTIGAGAPQPTAIPAGSVTGSGSANLTNTGGDSAHNNIQPSNAINYGIVA
jgi:microcystin-dependent protein